MLKFQNFPWGKVACVLPQDVQNFLAAVAAVGTNRYYGFRKDLGPAAATISSLAWLAKELFLRRGGAEADALRNFRGWIGTPLHKTALERLLEQ